MYYAQMRKFDIANGPGIRSSLFVSGCTHRCLGCFNHKYMSFSYGTKWDSNSAEEFLSYVHNPQVKGVTILGGEPMDQVQDDDLVNLLERIKKETLKNIWLYSGYTFEQIITHPQRKKILLNVDVLVDGLFIQEQKDFKLKFKGSGNQRIIDVVASIKQNRVVLLEDYA